MADPWKFRRDSAGEPFEAEICQHRPMSKIRVSAGHPVFSGGSQHRSTPPPVFELDYDL